MIITYKPESSAAHESIDINKAISTSIDPAATKMKALGQSMRLSSGKTYGELEFPEAAPLIFPALDRVAADSSAEGAKKQTKMKSSHKFLSNYMDQRAQARYAFENPDSSLAMPSNGAGAGTGKHFASRYSDPNHPASSGSLLGLLTGGVIDPPAIKQQMSRKKQDMRREVRRAVRRGDETDETPDGKRGGLLNLKGREGVVKRMLQKDVLYLMIVNLPSDEELDAARNAVRDAGQSSAK
jgi:hypothetical protein